jgi:hypothetical protein
VYGVVLEAGRCGFRGRSDVCESDRDSAYWWLSCDRRATYANPAGCRALDLQPATRLLHQQLPAESNRRINQHLRCTSNPARRKISISKSAKTISSPTGSLSGASRWRHASAESRDLYLRPVEIDLVPLASWRYRLQPPSLVKEFSQKKGLEGLTNGEISKSQEQLLVQKLMCSRHSHISRCCWSRYNSRSIGFRIVGF